MGQSKGSAVIFSWALWQVTTGIAACCLFVACGSAVKDSHRSNATGSAETRDAHGLGFAASNDFPDEPIPSEPPAQAPEGDPGTDWSDATPAPSAKATAPATNGAATPAKIAVFPDQCKGKYCVVRRYTFAEGSDPKNIQKYVEVAQRVFARNGIVVGSTLYGDNVAVMTLCADSLADYDAKWQSVTRDPGFRTVLLSRYDLAPYAGNFVWQVYNQQIECRRSAED
jgi:hypothetical protein